MQTLKRYKQNLRIINNDVYSYSTKVATIDWSDMNLIELSYWSVTTRKHVNYVGKELGLTVKHHI